MKKWAWHWTREASRKLEVPFNIYAMADASDFKFGTLIGFAKAHHKISHRAKSGRGLGLGKLPRIVGSLLISLQCLKLATSKLARGLGLPRPIMKLHTEKK